MADFTLSIFDTPRDQIQDIRDAVLATPFTNPELTSNHRVIDGISVEKEIPVFDRGFLMLGDGTECVTTTTDVTMPSVARKVWTPTELGYRLSFCSSDFNKFFSYMKAQGYNKLDLTQAQFWGWLADYIGENHQQELHRVTWFDDTDAAATTASPAGVINSATKVPFYNQFDGLWKQIFTINAANADTYVEVPANSASGQALSAQAAYDMLDAMYNAASIRLMADRSQLKFYVTDSVVRAFESYLRSQAVNSSFELIQRTQDGLAFSGIPLVTMPNWDVTIDNDMNVAGVKDKPHRALLTRPDNIPIGTETESNLTEMTTFYDRYQKKAFIDVFFLFDAKVYLDNELVAAY